MTDVLAHQMFMSWCPKCLRDTAWIRIYLINDTDRFIKRFCIECGQDEPEISE